MSDKRFVDRHTGWSIAIAVGLGLGAVSVLLWLYADYCWKSVGPHCSALRTSPPWIPLAALFTAPATILTWYWRTDHKKRDLVHVERELAHKDRESQTTAEREWRERFATGVELLGNGAPGSLYALESVAMDAPKRDYWAVIETICGYARLMDHENLELPRIKREAWIGAQAAIKVLGRREVSRDPPDRKLDLRGADLRMVVFRRGIFDEGDFSDTVLVGADLRGASFIGARFDNANAKDALVDESTVLDPTAQISLAAAGAKVPGRVILK